MSNQINELSDKLFKAIDPLDSYSYEQFIEEYGSMYGQSGDDLPFFVNLNFVNKSKNQDPEYATKGSSGFDLRASENKKIEPGCYEIVSTGLFFEIPEFVTEYLLHELWLIQYITFLIKLINVQIF